MEIKNSYILNNKQRFIEELFSLIKIPSISADSKYASKMHTAARMVSNLLKNAGCKKVEICPTKGYPIVYGEKIIDNKTNNLSKKIDKQKVPEHVAIIMDGNGRWATKKGLPRTYGHKKGVSVLK